MLIPPILFCITDILIITVYLENYAPREGEEEGKGKRGKESRYNKVKKTEKKKRNK